MDKTVFYNPVPSQEASFHVFNEMGFIGSYPLKYLTTIGRNSLQSTCDIALDSPIISRRHGEIVLSNDEYFYKDLGSTNGTYVNGRLYGRNSTSVTPLADGDIISFEIRQSDTVFPNKVFGLFTRSARTAQWQHVQLTEDMAELCIGRAVPSGLEISDAFISQKHASFFRSRNGWAIIDHNSTNGVYLNGKRITSPRYLSASDVVRLADTYFVFLGDRLFFSNGRLTDSQPIEVELASNTVSRPVDRNAEAQVIRPEGRPVGGNAEAQAIRPESRPVGGNAEAQAIRSESMSASGNAEVQAIHSESRGNAAESKDQLCINIYHRSVIQRFKKMMLLQNIKMTINNGEMVLILGGSGAGKTTFINAVMGYEKAEGKITYRDTDIYEEYEQMKFEIGFVPQQDLLRGSDTVYETLSNAAEMKMPKRISFEDREKRINYVLDEFGLSREKNSLVSKLSGGQRKRLSIAVEFISDPSLFFLDEPDSGLDDIMGRGLMENLRSIANKGKIVMIITHSPERAAELFDKVIVLAKSTKDNSGHLAFYGSIDQAFSFFEVSSFREIVKKINRKDENGEGLSDYFIEKYSAITCNG